MFVTVWRLLSILCGAPFQTRDWIWSSEIEVEVKLLPTVSRPVCRGVGLSSGAHGQIFALCLTIAGFLMAGALSDERAGL
jgi:hypothetical protein